MSENSIQTSLVSKTKISNMLLLANNFLFAMLLACPMIPGAARYFANTYLCLGIILFLSFLNYRFYKVIGSLTAADAGLFAGVSCWKLNTKVFAWAALVSAVILVGVGPITNPSAYAVDKFNRIFGGGVVNDYSVSKKVHYFYFVLIVYGLLVFCCYQNIRFALMINTHNRIRRIGEFADTLLFVGWSFLIVCVYRQFSNQFSYDLTLYLLKLFMVFMIPAFYFWETGKLSVRDVRVMLSLALFSLVLSVSIVFCFDTRSFGRFSDILSIVLLASLLVFIANKAFCFFDAGVLYSKIIVISLVCSLSLVCCSLVFEFTNILALKTDRFIDVGEIFHWVFYSACWLSLGWFCCVRKQVCSSTASRALFVFVLGVSILVSQPPLVIGSDLNIFESGNLSLPVSDFFNYGTIPLVENFPGHGLSGVISSILYGIFSSDFQGALFAPWMGWMVNAALVLFFYCFVRSISNGLVAVSAAVFLPYLGSNLASYGIGLVVLLPFIIYVRTLSRKYLFVTVIVSILLAAYKLDVGFTFIAGVICSSIITSIFSKKKILKSVISYFTLCGAACFVLFIFVCLIKDINPLTRIHEYLSIASSDDHWGYNTLGDVEKTSYSFFYFVVPVMSVLCFLIALIFRNRFAAVHFSVLVCLLFAYYANIPRLLVRHSLTEYVNINAPLWLWTIPIALSLLIAMLFSSRQMIIFCQTFIVLTVCIFFQSNTYFDNSPLQNAVARIDWVSAQIIPEVRKNDINTVFSRGSRVIYDEVKSESISRSNEIKAIADLLLSTNETYLDFTNQNAAYAWSRRRNPAYVDQSPAMLSGEISQNDFIQEIKKDLNSVPIAIMPTDKGWYFTMHLDGVNNNIRHYLVAEWIYNNYRPFIKFNDFSSVWVLKSRYDEFYSKLKDQNYLKAKNIQLKVTDFRDSLNAEQKPYCHNCTIRKTDAGLEIQPTGADPFVMDFDRLIGADDLKSFTYLTVYLANDSNDDYQVYFANDKVREFSEAYSLHAYSMQPTVKIFDLRNFYNSIGQLEKLRLDVPEHGTTVVKSASISTSNIPLIDWGYDNFTSLPQGAAPDAQYITMAHDYNVEFLPFIWGQFDSKNAASNVDLANVSQNGSVYTWDYSGKENKSAYLRVDLSVSEDFLKSINTSAITLGSMEGGKFTPLSRFRFKLKEGKKVYLFRISSDYYWSLGKLNALVLDPNLGSTAGSVRILDGD